jgi:hypothetical protein
MSEVQPPEYLWLRPSDLGLLPWRFYSSGEIKRVADVKIQPKAVESELQCHICGSRIVVGAGMSFATWLYNTQSKPEDQYGAGHDCVDLDAAEGMMYIDTVAEKIVHVEILNRQDIRHKLLEALP